MFVNKEKLVEDFMYFEVISNIIKDDELLYLDVNIVLICLYYEDNL